tara:strand:- start:104 stop:532 length:429 start_codon:yes stop_codon:yes gene_type:complete
MQGSAEEVIDKLQLKPHPEGGFFRETWRHETSGGERGAGTAIYYLLRAHERSHWHRVDAAEIWHFYAGGPLEVSISQTGIESETWTLHSTLGPKSGPQLIIPAAAWQAARALDTWALVGCTVSPAFEFSRFEMAPPDWSPGE